MFTETAYFQNSTLHTGYLIIGLYVCVWGGREPALDLCCALHPGHTPVSSAHVTVGVLLFLNFLPAPSGDSDGELLAKFCGHIVPVIPIVVFTPELWVHFQTDASQGDLGFKAKYLFSGKTDTDGFINSRGYTVLKYEISICLI